MITIMKSRNADSRTMEPNARIENLKDDTLSHIEDVDHALQFFADIISKRGKSHDHTKLGENLNSFYQALQSGKVKESDWYQTHITTERHHLKSHVPDDVNLVDVLEHLCDCTVAGLARSGDVYDIDIDPAVLVKACQNTVELLKKNCNVIEEEKDILDEEIN